MIYSSTRFLALLNNKIYSYTIYSILHAFPSIKIVQVEENKKSKDENFHCMNEIFI